MACSRAGKVEDDSQLFSCDRQKESARRGMGHAKGAAAPCMQEIYWGLIVREKKKNPKEHRGSVLAKGQAEVCHRPPSAWEALGEHS